MRDNIYNIFQKEKKRKGKEFTILYNVMRCTLQYCSDKGTLTVFLNENIGKETFYYRDKSISQKGKGIVFQVNSNYGNIVLTAEQSKSRVPKEFQEIANDYLKEDFRKYIVIPILSEENESEVV